MMNTTLDAIGSILKADQAVKPLERKQFLAILRNGIEHPPAQQVATPPGVIKPRTAAQRLNRSIRVVHSLAREGLLRKIRLPGRVRAFGIDEASLIELIQSGIASGTPVSIQTSQKAGAL